MMDEPKPATWDDLLDPAFAGMLGDARPGQDRRRLPGAGDSGLPLRHGRREGAEYLKGLHANIAQYVGTSPQAIELVGQGQFLMAPNWGHDILTAANRGMPVEFVAPAQTANEVGGISIVKDGPNTEGAKTFVDWVLTEEAVEAQRQAVQPPLGAPDVPPAPGAPTLDQVTLWATTRIWATDEQGPPAEGVAVGDRHVVAAALAPGRQPRYAGARWQMAPLSTCWVRELDGAGSGDDTHAAYTLRVFMREPALGLTAFVLIGLMAMFII